MYANIRMMSLPKVRLRMSWRKTSHSRRSLSLTTDNRAVWPDVVIKCSQKLPKVAQTSCHSSFYVKFVFKVYQKVANIWANLWKSWRKEVSKIVHSGHTTTGSLHHLYSLSLFVKVRLHLRFKADKTVDVFVGPKRQRHIDCTMEKI